MGRAEAQFLWHVYLLVQDSNDQIKRMTDGPNECLVPLFYSFPISTKWIETLRFLYIAYRLQPQGKVFNKRCFKKIRYPVFFT